MLQCCSEMKIFDNVGTGKCLFQYISSKINKYVTWRCGIIMDPRNNEVTRDRLKILKDVKKKKLVKIFSINLGHNI